LKKKNKYDAHFEKIKNTLKAVDHTLKTQFPFVLEVKVPNTPVGLRLKKQAISSLTTFINELGFKVHSHASPNTIRLKMKIAHSFVNQDQIGAHTHFVHAASGYIKVIDPSQTELVDLAVNFGGQTYTESDPNEEKAIQKALKLSQGRMQAKWRSLFRSQYVDPEEE
jgi:hypothetical protein